MGVAAARRTKVALVEDHAATRRELVALLETVPSVALVGVFADAESLLRSPARDEIEVALLDLGLPGMSGADAIRALAEKAPGVRTIALTVYDDEATVLAAIRAGAYGYLLKHEPTEWLVRAIDEAMAGGNPISSRVAGFLIARARIAPPPIALSDREHELAAALAEGLSYAECAERMGVALGTVQEYVKRLYRKLEVNSRSEVREWVARFVR